LNIEIQGAGPLRQHGGQISMEEWPPVLKKFPQAPERSTQEINPKDRQQGDATVFPEVKRPENPQTT
jgi:hypothetical protein